MFRPEAWSDGYTEGLKKGLELNFSISDTAKPLKIKLRVADIYNADSFRLAAAEVIRTQFPDWFVIDPEARLDLSIRGSEERQTTRPEFDVQDISVAVSAPLLCPFGAGKETRALGGDFTLAESGGWVRGYTSEKKIQFVREQTYKVLSEFLQKWQEASK